MTLLIFVDSLCSLYIGRCTYLLHQLVSINQHVLVQVLSTLSLVELELEFISLHHMLVNSLECMAQIGIHSWLICLVSGRNRRQLPFTHAHLGSTILVVSILFLIIRLLLSEHVESLRAIGATLFDITFFKVQE